MPGTWGRSGGHNRKTLEQHVLQGTHKASRHGPLPIGMTHGSLALKPPVAVAGPSLADRRRVLKGLSAEAKRIAAALLDGYDNWDETGLQTVRAYALSCERLEALQHGEAGKLLYAEVRANLQLLRALDLETDR